MEKQPSLSQSYLQRKLAAAKALVKGTNGLNIIQASDRVKELIEAEQEVEVLPPSFHEVDTLQVKPPTIHHTQDGFVMNRNELELGWDE